MEPRLEAGIAVTQLLPTLRSAQREFLSIICDVLFATNDLAALFFHGSYTRNAQSPDSDIDAIAVFGSIAAARQVATELPEHVRRRVEILFQSYSTRFPWFGRLWSFYFDRDHHFSLDLGIVTLQELDEFFVESSALIAFDPTGLVSKRRDQCSQTHLPSSLQSSAIEFDVFHTLNKIKRALNRGHLWTAWEAVSILRRILFATVRLEAGLAKSIGPAERRIETDFPWVSSARWDRTIPTYSRESIAAVTEEIVNEIRLRLRTVSRSTNDALLDETLEGVTAIGRQSG